MASDYFLPNQSPRTMVEEYYSQIRKKPAEQKWRLVSLFTVQSDYYYFLFFGRRISQDYHIKNGVWLRCTWTHFRDHSGVGSRILLYSADVTEEYEGNALLSAQMQEREAIIQGLGDVYYSVLLVDYRHDHVLVFRHEDEDGRKAWHNIWKPGYLL